MTTSQKVYTYRCGKKIELHKSADKMVVRALPDGLTDKAIVDAKQVSSASTRVTTSSTELESAMSRSRKLAVTHHAYYDKLTGTEFLITDRIVVVFKSAPSADQLDQFTGQYGLVQKAVYSDREYLFQLTTHTGMNPVKLVVKLTEEESLVEAADHDLNQRFQKYRFSVPQDPEYMRQWHLHTHYTAPDYDPRASVNCEDAWRLLDHFGSSEVVVAVTDDGCKMDHVDLNSPGKFADWGYFRGERLITSADVGADPQEMYISGADHGTACAGVIAGEVDAKLTVGAAPGCRLLPVQWESSGPSLYISDSKLLTALDFVADKVDIMSNSWGASPSFNFLSTVINRIRRLAVDGGRRGKGILFLWAAGNENCLINYRAEVDVPFTHGWLVYGDGSAAWIGPDTARLFERNFADIPGVMNIAALSSTAQRSHYSNYGPGIALCAPSSNMHAYYRMTLPGLAITTTTGEPGGVTREFGGTSSATPLAAGVAALVVSANADLSGHKIISILKQTASKDLNFERYSPTPPAVYNEDTSWDVSPIPPFDTGDFTDIGDDDGTWSPWFGFGRVDAKAAVTEALKLLGGKEELRFQGQSSPEKSIPDNTAEGIEDSIVCEENFSIASLKVDVNINHSYIGDLSIALISPAGTTVVLHDRAGGGAENIDRRFDYSTTAGLHQFQGEPAAGKWTLRVRDLAAQDQGRLQHWRLEINGQSNPTITATESPGIIIPDNSAGGIERILTVSDEGLLEDIQVDLDITHTYIGDLRVELVSPGHTNVLLHNRTGGAADNLIKRYSAANTPELKKFLGEEVHGAWKLAVSDRAGYDQGKLNAWALILKTAG